MGLLDKLQAYIQANTPRATRPVASPAKVFSEGLLNPNKYNAPAANRFKDSAFGLLGVVPGVGDAASAAESADLFNRGEKFAGSMAALGALPLVPALGGMFIGKGAKTWDVLKAQQAEDMLKQGIDPREVWKQTGTAKFADGMLRQEIPDNAAAFKKNGVRDLKDFGARKEGSIFEHGDLYNAYPDTADIVALRERGRDYSGYFTEDGNNIGLTFPDKKPDIESLKSLNVHELQHAIQQREGWASGGSPEAMAQQYGLARSRLHFLEQEPDYLEGTKQIDNLWNQAFSGNTMDEAAIAAKEAEIINQYPSLAEARKVMDELRQSDEYGFDSYKRLAGEAEARLTQSRMGLDAAQRLEHYPYDMGQYGLDVPMDQLIVRGLLGESAGPAMSKGGLLDAGGDAAKIGGMDDFKVKPPKALYRGSGSDGSTYGTYMLGKGVYSSPDKSFAAKYGDKIEKLSPEDAFPRNPLVINYAAGGAPSVFMDWALEKTGLKNAREFNAKYPDPGEFVKSLGYDGVVIGDEIVKY